MRNYVLPALLVLFVIFRCFSGLASRPLEPWDEANNATVVWELVSTQSFPFLTLHSKPFFEKPPLWYYLTGAAVVILGPTFIAFRIVNAVSGALLILFVYLAARRWYGTIGAIVSSGLLLITPHLFTTNAGGYFSTHTIHSADLDILHILFLFLTVLAFSNYRSKNPQWLFIGSVTTALAFLTKGPLAFVPVLVFGIYLFIHQKKKPIEIKTFVIAAGLFLLIIAPWYVIMTNRYGTEFLDQHFGYHIVRRVGDAIEGHEESVWYYARILQDKNVFPGFEILILSLLILFLHRKKLLSYETFMPTSLTLSIFIMATIGQTKLAWYILPMYPFAALVIGNAIQVIYKILQKKK